MATFTDLPDLSEVYVDIAKNGRIATDRYTGWNTNYTWPKSIGNGMWETVCMECGEVFTAKGRSKVMDNVERHVIAEYNGGVVNVPLYVFPDDPPY